MSREIKFRGIRIDKDEFVYGDLIHGVGCKKGKVYILPHVVNLAYLPGCHHLDGYEVKPETVGQFTGLTDKNGVEIYEGDVVENKVNKQRFCIQWGIAGESYAGWAGNWNGRDFISPLFNAPLENCEVIGNIHKSPELLPQD